jgi:NAD(P)-dependent dehydrogenase (short-subunit alcohol dehydrogenase family)
MNRRSAALVTGGAGGIGREAVRRLAGHGVHVVVVDIDRDAAVAVADDVQGSAVPIDVGDPHAWTAVTEHLERLGLPLAAALFNAGVALGEAELLDVDLAGYRRAWSVNVDGVVFGLRALAPLLAAARGHAVVTASLAGMTSVPFDPVYAMTKHALVGLVRGDATTVAAKGVGLHAVCPGLVDTAMLGTARGELEDMEFPLVEVADVAGGRPERGRRRPARACPAALPLRRRSRRAHRQADARAAVVAADRHPPRADHLEGVIL